MDGAQGTDFASSAENELFDKRNGRGSFLQVMMVTISMSLLNSGGGGADAHRGEHSVDHFGPFAEAGNAMFEALDEERLDSMGLSSKGMFFGALLVLGAVRSRSAGRKYLG